MVAINLEKWDILQEAILQDASAFNMGAWHGYYIKPHEPLKPFSVRECGTAHCIAGFADVLQSPVQLYPTDYFDWSDETPLRAVRWLLDLDHAPSWLDARNGVLVVNLFSRLFFTSEWPRHLRLAYEKHSASLDSMMMARTAVMAMKWWLDEVWKITEEEKEDHNDSRSVQEEMALAL